MVLVLPSGPSLPLNELDRDESLYALFGAYGERAPTCPDNQRETCIMELEIYSAFAKAGVPEAEAKAAVESINKETDKRYSLHAHQLATRADIEQVRKDLSEANCEIPKWTIATMFAAVGIFAAISKVWY